MLKLSRRGVAPPRSHTHAQLLVPLWKLFKRREVRSLKFVMLLGRLLYGTFSIFLQSYSLQFYYSWNFVLVRLVLHIGPSPHCFNPCEKLFCFNIPLLMVLHGIYLVCKFVVRSRSALRRPRMRRRPRKQRWRNLRRHKLRVQHQRVLKAPRSVVAVGSAECPLHHRDIVVN